MATTRHCHEAAGVWARKLLLADNWGCNQWAAVNGLSLLQGTSNTGIESRRAIGALAGLGRPPSSPEWVPAPISGFQNARMQPREFNNQEPLRPLFVIMAPASGAWWAVPQPASIFLCSSAPEHHRPADYRTTAVLSCYPQLSPSSSLLSYRHAESQIHAYTSHQSAVGILCLIISNNKEKSSTPLPHQLAPRRLLFPSSFFGFGRSTKVHGLDCPPQILVETPLTLNYTSNTRLPILADNILFPSAHAPALVPVLRRHHNTTRLRSTFQVHRGIPPKSARRLL